MALFLSAVSRTACRTSSRMTSNRTLQLATTQQLQRQQRSLVTRTLPLLNDDLPYHIVMGMPALSPTMDAGSLAEWYVKEGDSFIAGDSLAKIETDKATIDFEAQDDGYVAKLLVQAGGGSDIEVGKAIMVTVEEQEDVAAFANFVAPEAAEEEPSAAAPPTPPPAAAPPAPPKVEEPKTEAPPAPAPPAATPPPPAAAAPAVAASSMSGGAWGNLASTNSPIAKTLGKQQQIYQEKYGRTGQVPL